MSQRKTRKTRTDPADIVGDLCLLYDKEAKKCERTRAYLAGCIMLGAALEAGLLTMVLLYPEEVTHTRTYRSRKKPARDVTKWGLFDLLKVARELSWIPSMLPIDSIARLSGVDPEVAWSKGDLSYFADFVREVRDIVHPGRYMTLWKRTRITKNYYGVCYDVVNLVLIYFMKKLAETVQTERLILADNVRRRQRRTKRYPPG